MKNKLIYSVFVILYVAISSSSHYSIASDSNPGMRRCALLPVDDVTEQGNLGFQVFKAMEEKLKESSWCYYKSNSDILDLLENHRKSIALYLQNPKVLKLISRKLNAGSLIGIKVEHVLRKIKLSLKILGSNGKDVYFKRSKKMDFSFANIIDTLESWINLYENDIPYNARIKGILGKQFTIDGGSSFNFHIDDNLTIIRPIRKKRHPLLKEIVEYQTIQIATARVYNTTQSSSFAKIRSIEPNQHLKIDDWVIVNYQRKNSVISDNNQNKLIFSNQRRNRIKDNKAYKFGKLGIVNLFLKTSIFQTDFNGTSSKRLKGLDLGVNFEVETWITRNYFASLLFSTSFASPSTSTGTFTGTTNTTNSEVQVFGGYKYLPLGFFYGPQLNIYAGFGKYSYSYSSLVANNLTNFSISGFLIGINSEIPFMKKFRAKLGVDLLFAPSLYQQLNVLGNVGSTTSSKFYIQGNYKYKLNLDFIVRYQNIKNSVLLTGSYSSLDFINSSLYSGVAYTF